MTIRWRLALVAIQLTLLTTVTHYVTGQFYSSETWYLAGLLAIGINPQLLEPYFVRPVDVLVNSVAVLLLFLTTSKTVTTPGWNALMVLVALLFLSALAAILAGAGKPTGEIPRAARAGRYLSQFGTSRLLYSVVFFLSAYEYSGALDSDFWALAIVWALQMLIGVINWQTLFSMAGGATTTAHAEGMIGPSSILVSAPDLPRPGTLVNVKTSRDVAEGVVINRVRRPNDVWGQVFIPTVEACERMLESQNLTLTPLPSASHQHQIVGSVDAGSTDRRLRFTATSALEVGSVISVPVPDTAKHVLYQLSSAEVERLDVRGGSHLVVRAIASQLGVFNADALRLVAHRWVPTPGQPVLLGDNDSCSTELAEPDGSMLLGHVMGTKIPVFLDLEMANSGHVAILGMTKMGKSSLAERLACRLGKERVVFVLDQTGEWVCKKGLPPCGEEKWERVDPGVAVFEPAPNEVPAQRALAFMQFILTQARAEYVDGTPTPRTVIIDEAHQFIPEPAGLGFGSPGRDESYLFGTLMMQIRKYGIAVILISQRTAVVAKSALSQCENLIAFKSVDQTGLEYLDAVAGGGVRGMLPRLNQGEAIIFGPAVSSDEPVAVIVARETDTAIDPTPEEAGCSHGIDGSDGGFSQGS